MATSEIKVNTKVGGEQKSAVVAYDFGDTLEEMRELFGDDVVFSAAKRMLNQDAGNLVRGWLVKGHGQAEIDSKFAHWKPGVSMPRESSPLATIASRASKLSAEELEEAIALLQAKKEGI